MALVVVGVVVVAYGTDAYVALVAWVGRSAEPNLHVVDITLTVVRSVAFPLAAALTGAAIVIQTLAERQSPITEP